MPKSVGFIVLALCLAGPAAAPASGGESCPAPAVYEKLHKNMAALRAELARRFGPGWSADRLPESVRKEYERLTDAERKAANTARDLAEGWSDVDSKLWQADFDRRDIDGKRRQIDREQKDLKDKFADLNKRVREHNADADRQRASMPAPDNAAAVAAYNAWGERINRRKTALEAERDRLNGEQTALGPRRDQLFKDLAEVTARIARQLGRRSAVMREMAPFMSRAAADAMHALALAQLTASDVAISVPAAERRRSYAEVTSEAEKQLAETVAREAALQIAKRTVLGATGPGLAVAAVDVTLATGNAAVDVRTREVERNLLLIGDYAQLLRRMKAGGTLKADDPHYQAIRAVLKEQGEAMPADGVDVLIEGLKSWRAVTAAMTSTLSTVAGAYAGGKAERAGSAVVKHLGNMDRKVLGPRMVRFFKTAINSLAESGSGTVAGQVVDAGGKWVDEQLYGPKAPDLRAPPTPDSGSGDAPR